MNSAGDTPLQEIEKTPLGKTILTFYGGKIVDTLGRNTRLCGGAADFYRGGTKTRWGVRKTNDSLRIDIDFVENSGKNNDRP